MSAPQLALFERPKMLRDKYVAPVGRGVITPRSYQRDQHAAVNREFETHRSTLVVGATGTGKTVLVAMQAHERGTVLVVAQDESIIEQTAQKIRHVTGAEVWVEKAHRRAPANARYIVASAASLRGERLANFAAQHDVRFLVFDEAHHAMAETYLGISAAFPAAKLLGLTATPDRGDKKALRGLFETVAHRYELWDATRDGWLAPLSWFPMNVLGVRLDDVGIVNGDLDQAQLDKLVAREAAQIARSVVQHAQGMRSIVFAPGVQTALVAAEALNDIEKGSAYAIHCHLPPGVAQDIKAEHKRGAFPYLLNFRMLVEGYDDERLRCVFDLAKTKVRALFAQKPGRVTRPWPCTVDGHDTAEARRAAIAASPKPRALFYDAHYGKHGHQLAVPADALGGLYDVAVRERAQANLEAKGGGDVLEALEEAKHEVEAAERRKVKRTAKAAAAARGNVITGDALTDPEMFGESVEIEDGERMRPFDLAAWLVEQGIEDAAQRPIEAQRSLRKQLIERKRAGKGSVRQVRALKRVGVPDAVARDLPAKRCGMILGKLRGRAFNPETDAWMLREKGAANVE